MFRKCARRCPEVPGGARRCAPGKNRSKKNRPFYRSGKHFSDKGGFENPRGKGGLPGGARRCPEVPGGLRNEADTRKLATPNPKNTPKKKPPSTFGPFCLAHVHFKPPRSTQKANSAISGPPQTRAKQNPLFLMNTFGSSSSKTPCLVTFKCLMWRNLGQAKIVVV